MYQRLDPPTGESAWLRRAICFTALLVGLVGIFPAALAQQPAAAPEASGYHCVARWKLDGEGNWNFAALDSQTHRLYVARTGGVQVIDLQGGILVRMIPGLDDGHGVALAPDVNCGFATSSRSDAVVVFNLTSLRVSGTPIPVGRKPDAIVYEPLTRHVLVFNSGSRDASVIDAATATVIATIPLDGVPGSAVSDGNGSVYVNLEDKNEAVAVDSQKNTVTHRWPLIPGSEPTGLAVDSIKHRLFAGCRDGRMIVLDTQTGKPLATLLVGQTVEACAADPGTGLAFASCGGEDGTLVVVQEDSARPGRFQMAESVKTQRSARLMAVDSKTHAVYLATAGLKPLVASTADEEPLRRETAPSDFVLLRFLR